MVTMTTTFSMIPLYYTNQSTNQPTKATDTDSTTTTTLPDDTDASTDLLAVHCQPLSMRNVWDGQLSVRTGLGVSVSVSAQDGIVALGKAHTRSAPSLSSLPKVALETVPIFVWLNTDRSRPWRVECRPLPFSTPLSFMRSML